MLSEVGHDAWVDESSRIHYGWADVRSLLKKGKQFAPLDEVIQISMEITRRHLFIHEKTSVDRAHLDRSHLFALSPAWLPRYLFCLQD